MAEEDDDDEDERGVVGMEDVSARARRRWRRVRQAAIVLLSCKIVNDKEGDGDETSHDMSAETRHTRPKETPNDCFRSNEAATSLLPGWREGPSAYRRGEQMVIIINDHKKYRGMWQDRG